MKSRLYLIVYILCLCLTGCIKYVDVPVWVCPEPNIPVKQPLKTGTILKQSSDDEKIKAMIWDVVYLDGYSKQLATILEGYKKK